MDWDKEELALRVMRLLFQLNQQDGEVGLDFDTLLNRAGFTNINNEKPLLEQSLIELEDQALIYKHKKEYYISKVGIKWYSQFKYKFFQTNEEEIKGRSKNLQLYIIQFS